MTKKEYLQFLTKLSGKFTNLDRKILEDANTISVWYDTLKHLELDEIMFCLQNYKSVFPPTTPNAILNVIDEITNNQQSAEEFSNFLLQVNRNIGFTYNSQEALATIEEKYGKQGVETAKYFINELKNLTSDKTTTIRAQIRETYKVQKQRESVKLPESTLARIGEMKIRSLEMIEDE